MTVTHRNNPWFYAFLIVAAGLIATAFIRGCDKPEPIPIPAPEQQRLDQTKTDSIRKAAYQERDNYYRPILKAQDHEIIRLTSEDKQQHTKAQRSADTFEKTPTLDNCKEALVDCQGEVVTKAAVIASQAQRIDSARAQRVNDSLEIIASHKAAQEFNAGWETANLENAKMQKQNAKKWGVGLQIGYGLNQYGHGPTVSIGVQRTLFRF